MNGIIFHDFLRIKALHIRYLFRFGEINWIWYRERGYGNKLACRQMIMKIVVIVLHIRYPFYATFAPLPENLRRRSSIRLLYRSE